MPRTVEGGRLTERHRQAQLKVRAAASRDFIRLWPLWRGDRRSFEELAAATVPLTDAYRLASGAIAADYYEAFRRAERVPGDATPISVDPVDRDKLIGTLLVVGEKMTGQAVAAGQAPQTAMRNALVRTSGSVSRFVLDGGREVVIRSAGEDRQARGWQRVTSGKACAFCAMLAGRGAVYEFETVTFRAHDHCSCSCEPAFEGSTLPAASARYRQLYDQAVGEARELGELERGTSNDSLNAFRRLLARQD